MTSTPRRGSLGWLLDDVQVAEARLPVARNVQLDLAGLGQHRLAAVAVPAIAGAALAGQRMVHLRVQHALGERLLQVVQQAVRIERALRIGAGQKLVQQRVGNNRRFASGHRRSPFSSLCPPAHKIPDSPHLFGEAFFRRYGEIRPIRPGFFELRRDLYNLYPLLVHVRLFGGSYVGSVERTVRRLVGQARS